jgi:hypothetical protein
MKMEDRRWKTEDAPTEPEGPQPDGRATGELCDYCGAEALTWRKCKLICESCGNIVKSCADL